MNHPVLFLDVDGVLNRCGRSNQGLETDKCDLLADLCRRTGCKVVVSSTWRKYPLSMRRLLAMFISYDIPFIGETPVHDTPAYEGSTILSSPPRWEEITAWLKAHPEVTRYAIVDDDGDADDGTRRFVKTSSYEGLTVELAAELERILTKTES